MRSHAKASPSGSTTTGGAAGKRSAFGLLAAALVLFGLVLGTTLALAASPSVIHTYVSAVTTNEATLNSEIDFEAPTDCRFEYGTSESYGSEVDCAEALQTYTLTISATSGQFRLKHGADTTADLPFNAGAEQLKTAIASLPSLASIEGLKVSGGPGDAGGAFPYSISFVDQLHYQRLTVEDGTTPLAGGTGASLSPRATVSARLEGLDPDATYHYRLSAANADGPTSGEDRLFRTYGLNEGEDTCPNAAQRAEVHATQLPDCRAWELVSPPDKSGGDVIPMTDRVRVAADGDAANFASLVSFGDVQGTTIGTEYIARRTAAPGTSGWATHGITPTQDALPQTGAVFGLDPAYDGEMSDDLSAGVFRAYRPITDDPNVAGLINLYVRKDLLTPGPGSYQVITDPGFAVPPPFSPFIGIPALAGASSDFSHVIFESLLALDKDASEFSPNLYEWDGSALHLVGRVPPSGETECDDDGAIKCQPAAASHAGLGALNNFYTQHMISADGSRVFFTDPTSSKIYMRVDSHRTVQLNVSERTTPESPQAATLWDASVDGNRVFFSTSEGLIDEDEDGGAGDYYMYEVGAPAGHRLTLVSTGGTGGQITVVGTGEDGHYAYFMSNSGLYAWHDGAVTLLGGFAFGNDVYYNILAREWSFTYQRMRARVSADGSHLMLFTSSDDGFEGRGGFAGYDHGCGIGCQEAYVYDADADKLRCASCNPSEAPPESDANVNVKIDSYASDISSTSHRNRALSGDGRWAFFTTPDSLLPEDTNGTFDAYRYDTETEEVSLLSSGTSPEGSYFMDASVDGRDAFFVTQERLSGWDVDGSYDLYDARVGGGLPEPPSHPAPCEGESCPAAVPPVPPIAAVGSASPGPGNPPSCRKGKVRRRGRCVAAKQRKRSHKRATKKRDANTDRRAGK